MLHCRIGSDTNSGRRDRGNSSPQMRICGTSASPPSPVARSGLLTRHDTAVAKAQIEKDSAYDSVNRSRKSTPNFTSACACTPMHTSVCSASTGSSTRLFAVRYATAP